VVTLERAVNHEDLKKYLEEYSISLGKSAEDPSIETRGVMVIKSKSKTKARQRKGALANWKVKLAKCSNNTFNLIPQIKHTTS